MDRNAAHDRHEARKISEELRHGHLDQARKELQHDSHNPREFNKIVEKMREDLHKHHSHALSIHRDHHGNITHLNFGKPDIYDKHSDHHKQLKQQDRVHPSPERDKKRADQPATPLLHPGQTLDKPATPLPHPGQTLDKPATPLLHPGQTLDKPATPLLHPGQTLDKPATPLLHPGQTLEGSPATKDKLRREEDKKMLDSFFSQMTGKDPAKLKDKQDLKDFLDRLGKL